MIFGDQIMIYTSEKKMNMLKSMIACSLPA